MAVLASDTVIMCYMLKTYVCLSKASIVAKWLNVGSQTMPHSSPGTLVFWCQSSQ